MLCSIFIFGDLKYHCNSLDFYILITFHRYLSNGYKIICGHLFTLFFCSYNKKYKTAWFLNGPRNQFFSVFFINIIENKIKDFGKQVCRDYQIDHWAKFTEKWYTILGLVVISFLFFKQRTWFLINDNICLNFGREFFIAYSIWLNNNEFCP